MKGDLLKCTWDLWTNRLNEHDVRGSVGVEGGGESCASNFILKVLGV